MSDLIEALKIFLKYKDSPFPTHCDHDIMMVLIEPSIVSNEDLERLYKLGFTPSIEHGEHCFISHKFGSA